MIHLGHDERLRDQIGKAMDDLRWRDVGARRHGTGRFQAEHTAEYPQAAKDHTLGLKQKLIAPVERRPQGLMARQRRPPPAGQQVEAIVEMGDESARR